MKRHPICLTPWLLLLILSGCERVVRVSDRDVARAIAERQRVALAYEEPAPVPHDPADARVPRSAYGRAPTPVTQELPEGFEPREEPVSGPSADPSNAGVAQAAGGLGRQKFRALTLTLTEALRYAQNHRREFLTAEEDMYLSALALTLERKLWTPQFSSSLRSVYGNFGEITDFDQATRFVGDLGVSQRLPYGGQFTARALATLIRDVKRSITAEESGAIELGLNVPFLRGAGHVAYEQLLQLERELTYAVRAYERFRRQQLVRVAAEYFRLLASKQRVTDAFASMQRALDDLQRAEAVEREGGFGSSIETRRAEQRALEAENNLAQQQEAFRFATDQFKLLIGMPVDEFIGLDDLEDIAEIERQVAAGDYPLLLQTKATMNEAVALESAVQYRLDLLTASDRIDDARRGVAVARNALLPNLDWNSTLTFNTDPDEYRVTNFEVARATWRTEVILSMDNRYPEQTNYRRSLIDVRRAERDYRDQYERVRVDVRGAINQVRLQERVIEIQRRSLEVAELQAEYSRIQFNDGEIDNIALVDAERDLINAQNQLAQAKTDRWSALLNFRLATGTLRVPELDD